MMMTEFQGIPDLVHSDLWYGKRDHKKFEDSGYIVFEKFLTDNGLQVILNQA
jgi:hypothetical protein